MKKQLFSQKNHCSRRYRNVLTNFRPPSLSPPKKTTYSVLFTNYARGERTIFFQNDINNPPHTLPKHTHTTHPHTQCVFFPGKLVPRCLGLGGFCGTGGGRLHASASRSVPACPPCWWLLRCYFFWLGRFAGNFFGTWCSFKGWGARPGFCRRWLWHKEPYRNGNAPCVTATQLRSLSRS